IMLRHAFFLPAGAAYRRRVGQNLLYVHAFPPVFLSDACGFSGSRSQLNHYTTFPFPREEARPSPGHGTKKNRPLPSEGPVFILAV
ncbi:MAG: hypothetical protein ACI4MK_03190, partial [Aristaeellaceae bacterium]